MRYILILLTFIFPIFVFGQFKFHDDFELYNIDSPLHHQSHNWHTWDSMVEIQSAYVTNKKSFSQSNSLYLHSPHWAGGPTDLVFPFTKKIDEGLVKIEMMMYIDDSAGAYFNLQSSEKLGSLYALHISFDSDSSITISNYKLKNERIKIGFYPKAQWFKISIHVDLSKNLWQILINNIELYSFQNPINSISALNFFPRSNNGRSSFYIDDIIIDYIPTLKETRYLDLISAQTEQFILKSKYNKLSCEVINRGRDIINSIELKFTNQVGIQLIKRFENLLISQDQKIKLFWDSIYVMDQAQIKGILEIISVNDSTNFLSKNKSLNCSSSWVENAPNKAIFFEAMASTKCGYSPFLYAFIDKMKAKYGDLFIPVVNHHNDPLSVLLYDKNYLFDFWHYYYFAIPFHVLNNARDEIYLGDSTEQVFLQRLTDPSYVKIDIGAVFDSIKSIMNINFLTYFIKEFPQNSLYKIYITKNIKHKNDPELDQANWYSSLKSGKANGYEQSPNPIKSLNMEYNHVIKYILPSQNGTEYKPREINPIHEGEILQRQESIPWPLLETDFENYDVIVLFPNNPFETAKKINLADALKSGIITSISESYTTKQDLFIYPNPANDHITMSYKSMSHQQSSIQIIDAQGKLVKGTREEIHKGDNIIKLELSKLPAGAYVFKFKTHTNFLTKIFIVQ